MKTVKVLLIALSCLMIKNASAQLSVNINIGTPPMWAPAAAPEAKYYYLPDVESYYDVTNSNFIYMNNGQWIRGASLPGPYANYDLYHGYKVVMTDYHGSRPYDTYNVYHVKYHKGYKGGYQKTFKDKKEHHDNSSHSGRHDNGHGEKHDNGNGHDDDHGNHGNGHGEGHGEGHGNGHGHGKD
ncbi:hypothetical protein [Parasediminibacterium sp. JCM 36343]|uniref:hypothetical protein n=1 Tax=Parasediminibacterium sp. JCM 36343 TaxID=3374279 RepID=UPI00397C7D69